MISLVPESKITGNLTERSFMADTIHNQKISEVLSSLHTDPNKGLSKSEAIRRLAVYGFNEVPEKKSSMVKEFLKKFWGVTAWMLELIMLLSWFLHRYTDLYIVTILLVANAIISFAQEWTLSKAVESLKKKLRMNVKVLRDGVWALVLAREIVPGDIITIKIGDFVPADMKIISGSLDVDQSALTGESLTIEKNPEDLVYSGSIVSRGEAIGVVTVTGTKTYFGKTVELVQQGKPRSHIETVVASITKWLLAFVFMIVLVVFIISMYRGLPPLEIFPLMLVLLMAGIPVALPAMFTVSMALGARKLSKKNLLITRLNVVEDAATMTILCVDKTGTLTLNQLAVAQVFACKGYMQHDVLLYGALASQEASLDPIDLAFITAAKQQNLPTLSYSLQKFIPFDPKTKRTEAVVEKDGKGVHAYKGALFVMAKDFQLSQEESNSLAKQANAFAQKGFRTIVVAKGADDRAEIMGLVALEDPPRPEAKQTVRELRDLGITLKLLTGDALPIAEELAQKIDLDGKSLNFATYRDTKSSLSQALRENDIFAEIYPEDKYNIVQAFQKNGQIVGMTGDGVNDAPALHAAEVGIAVNNATDVAKKAASVILTSPGLGPIKELISMGRLVFQRVNTWILNKLSRTVLKIGFIVVAFLVTGRFVISSREMLLLICMTDFVKISLATDNERISKTACHWDIPELNRIAIILGCAMVLEALVLLYIGMIYLHIPFQDVRTFSFAILFYFAVLSVFVVREKGHFWESTPSTTLLAIILVDILVGFIITTFGFIGFRPLPMAYSFLIMGYAMVFSLFANDFLKLYVQNSGLLRRKNKGYK